MKSVILLCALTVMVVGKSVTECPSGEHPRPDCPKIYEPTCEDPRGRPYPHRLCEMPPCFCDLPTVRDPYTKKCISLEECILPKV